MFGILSTSRRNESQTLCNRVASSCAHESGTGGKGGQVFKLATPLAVKASELLVPGVPSDLQETIEMYCTRIFVRRDACPATAGCVTVFFLQVPETQGPSLPSHFSSLSSSLSESSFLSSFMLGSAKSSKLMQTSSKCWLLNMRTCESAVLLYCHRISYLFAPTEGQVPHFHEFHHGGHITRCGLHLHSCSQLS